MLSRGLRHASTRVASGGRPPVALVVGAGDATGSAIARRFAHEGLAVAVVRRPQGKEALEQLAASIRADGGHAKAYPVDARQEKAVEDLVDAVEADLGPIEVLIHNIGANVRFKLADTSARVFYKVWEMATFSAFLTSRAVSVRMQARGRGTVILTGATASMRGSPGFCAFSSAMMGKRALAQAMATELGPQGVHVVHCVVDGPIETAFVRGIMGDSAFEAHAQDEKLLRPDAIAETYVQLWKQPRCAWTHEIDLRPYAEPLWWSGGGAVAGAPPSAKL